MTRLNESDIREAFEAVDYEIPVSKIVSGAQRRRHRRRLALSAVPTIGLLAAAGYAIRSEPTSEPFSVGCYNELAQDADTTILRWEEDMTPAEVCLSERAAWGDSTPTHVVTCVTNGGATGVFPNPEELSAADACASIGAAVPDDGASYGGLTAAQVRDLSQELGRRTQPLNDPGAKEICYPNETLRREVEAFLRQRDLSEWTVTDKTTSEAAKSSAGERCGDIVYDSLGASILIVDGDRAD